MFRKCLLPTAGLLTVVGLLFGEAREAHARWRCGCSNGSSYYSWGGGGTYGQSTSGYPANGSYSSPGYYSAGAAAPGYYGGQPVQTYKNSPMYAAPRAGNQYGTTYGARSGSIGTGSDSSARPSNGLQAGGANISGRANGSINSILEDGTSDSPKFRNRVYGISVIDLSGATGAGSTNDMQGGTFTTEGADTGFQEEGTMPSFPRAPSGPVVAPHNGNSAIGGTGPVGGAGTTTGGAGPTGPQPGEGVGGIGGGGPTGGFGGTRGSGGGAGSGSGGGPNR